MQMIEAKDLFNINFYKTDPFYGSFKGMNYRIIKYAPEQDSDATVLRVSTWPGPYIYDVTPDEQKIHKDFPFNNEGLAQAADYLNQIWDETYSS